MKMCQALIKNTRVGPCEFSLFFLLSIPLFGPCTRGEFYCVNVFLILCRMKKFCFGKKGSCAHFMLSLNMLHFYWFNLKFLLFIQTYIKTLWFFIRYVDQWFDYSMWKFLWWGLNFDFWNVLAPFTIELEIKIELIIVKHTAQTHLELIKMSSETCGEIFISQLFWEKGAEVLKYSLFCTNL